MHDDRSYLTLPYLNLFGILKATRPGGAVLAELMILGDLIRNVIADVCPLGIQARLKLV